MTNPVRGADVVGPSAREARTALLLLVSAYTLSITDRMILTVLFEPIRLEFGVSDTQMGLLGGLSFALFYATLGIPIARAADRGNRKLIIVASLAVFSLMTALSGLAVGFVMLLLLRIGVGVGEAGVSPASQSIIADYFPKERRASAMSVLIVGANVGMIIGYLVGGFVSQHYGWRAALVVVGLPGLALAVVMYARLREPIRGAFEAPAAGTDASPTILQTAAFMFGSPAVRQLLIASTISGTVTYGLTTWLPTFFVRAHGLSQSEVGLLMALAFGVVGAIGAFVGGKWVDRLSRGGLERGLWMIAATQLAVVPLSVLAYQAGPLALALVLFALPVFVSPFYLGPTLALIQTLSPVPMRAVAAAIKMLCLNLVGMGLGPLIVGALSDGLTDAFGEASLRVALSITVTLGLWSALHFWLCGRALARLPQPSPSSGSTSLA